MKPRKGYSSVNTWIIHGEATLQELLGSSFNTVGGFDSALDLEIEEFIKGNTSNRIRVNILQAKCIILTDLSTTMR